MYEFLEVYPSDVFDFESLILFKLCLGNTKVS